MIISGNGKTQSEVLLDRFSKFFIRGITDIDGTKYGYRDIIKSKTRSEIVFFNDTRIHTYPALAESLRGPGRVICVFFYEAAHVHQLNDSQVYDALKPNLANTNGDFIMVSTPNGRRGIFCDLWENGDFFKLEIPYTQALGKLLPLDFIEREKKERKFYFDQEYNCQFTQSGIPSIDINKIRYTKGPMINLDKL